MTGETSGTTATFVIVDGWTVTVACVGDSRCILDTQGSSVSNLTVDHRLEDNAEEYVHFFKSLPCHFHSLLLFGMYVWLMIKLQERACNCKWW